MSNELISIILPVFNREKTIIRSVNSVLNQTYKNFELIIVDDHSSDNTVSLLKNINDKRMIIIELDKNVGAAKARNIGISKSSGKLIAFQDSDDEWIKNKLEIQYKILKKSSKNVGVVYSGYFRYKDGIKEYLPPKKIHPKEGKILKNLLLGNYITIHSMVKKECFEKVGGFDESLPRLQDWELWIRIAKYYNFVFIDEPLVKVYYMEDSITADKSRYIPALEMIIEKHYLLMKEENIKALSKQLGQLGKLYLENGERFKAKKVLLKSIKMYPTLKSTILLLFSFFNQKFFIGFENLYKKLRS